LMILRVMNGNGLAVLVIVGVLDVSVRVVHLLFVSVVHLLRVMNGLVHRVH